MDGFCEQVVKRQSGAKQKVLSGMIVGIFALLELFFIFVYVIVPDPFWLVFTLIIAILAVIVLTLALPRINKVEFDYSVMGNNFYIDKVVDKKSRKKLLRIEINSIEDMGKIQGDNIPADRYARTKDCSSGNMEESYYCVYREAGKGKCLLIFSPNQNIIDGMRPHMTREMVVKFFYNKK
ncbi:MAG: hypothetical protein IJ298_10265 [Ruminococcus sp.]|nr:hypothetical protein [Ruminococcus sp.]